jgi:hypothetical protein
VVDALTTAYVASIAALTIVRALDWTIAIVCGNVRGRSWSVQVEWLSDVYLSTT